ncbi:CTB family bacteriocin [aff. Roholtiella sp. LEGE 12411]|jgi:hypothetical protein|uniref:CTB family bacteriocin n=1 Tax=aff. Roholtiella sp. LEGE 12411 TaxID=1828822 RepID=UPI00187DE2F1|nr:CTB family bacteriocin [aff. Roholtiella sp. LEGE 12411]MBE9037983.1 CTB family bacteriocin [aff. Roholtiella sp. LEGE 12411]
MSGDEITPNNEAIELSDEDLDEVAGGFSLRLTAARFQQSKLTSVESIGSGSSNCSAQSAFQAETTESSLFQLTIVDATTEDIQALGELFGDMSAIDGST